MAATSLFQPGVQILTSQTGRYVFDNGGPQWAVMPYTAGTFTLNGSTPVTVAQTAITANSQIDITLKTVGGTVGATPAIQTITVGVGFTVAGTAGDTSIYNYSVNG